jgi:hypothetical protein
VALIKTRKLVWTSTLIIIIKNRIHLVTNYGLIQFNHIGSNKFCLRMLLQQGKLIVSWVIPKTLYNFIGERKSIKNKINLIRFDSILHTMIH